MNINKKELDANILMIEAKHDSPSFDTALT
jgi:hypothetical protein